MLTPFDAALIIFFFLTAIVALGVLLALVDMYLDPHCTCADRNRQTREVRGVQK